MYQKPQVVKFGTLRELTQLGCDTDGDSGFVGNAIGGTIDACFTRTS